MAFVDECTVWVQAGRGGDGSVSRHSEPYKPKGGPDGGNGGPGGSVIFEVTSGVHDLGWLADHPHQRAASGGPGRSARRDGAAGKDLVISVPDGTVISDEEGLLADLVGEGARAVVAQGGGGVAATSSSRPRRTAFLAWPNPVRMATLDSCGWRCGPSPTWASSASRTPGSPPCSAG